MKITHNITLDMLKPRYEVVNVKQGAELTQWVHANLVVGGSAWTPPSDATIEVRCKKPDRTTVLYSSAAETEANGFLISGSSVEVRLHTQMMTCAGKFPVDIAFKKDDEVLPLFSFILDVERQAATNDEMASVDYITEALVHASADVQMLDHDDYESTDVIVEQPSNTRIIFHFKVPYGEKGDSVLVKSSTYAYAASSSGVSPPSRTSSLWKNSPPSSPTPGGYLWTRAIITYENTTKETILYSVSRYGEKGEDGYGALSDNTDTPLIDYSNGSVGSSTNAARADHQHPLNVDDTVSPSVIVTPATASAGTSTKYSRADHKHASQNKSITVTLSGGSSWIQQPSGTYAGLYKKNIGSSIVGSDFFKASGYVYIVAPVLTSRDLYSSYGIMAADVDTDDQMNFYATSQPKTGDSITVHIMKMVSA